MTLFSHNFKNIDISLRIFDFVFCCYKNNYKDIEVYISVLFIEYIYKNIKDGGKLLYSFYKFDINKFSLSDVEYMLKCSLKMYQDS